MAGSIAVNFAGTLAEAREFATVNGLSVFKQAGDFPIVGAQYKNGQQLIALQAKLKELGWEIEFQMVRSYGRAHYAQ